MINYKKFACNNYDYADVMSADLDEYLEDNNLNLFELDYTECGDIAYELSGLKHGSYTCNTVEAAIYLANNYAYIRYLMNEEIIFPECYIENPEFCDCIVRYYVTLEILFSFLKEQAR